VIAGDGCSEICLEIGYYYEEAGDYEEAALWYYNAAFQTQPVLSAAAAETEPLAGLVRCYEQLGLLEQAQEYRNLLDEKK